MLSASLHGFNNYLASFIVPLSFIVSSQHLFLLSRHQNFYIITKHVELDIHFVQENVSLHHVQVLHEPASQQFVDILTYQPEP